MHGDFTRDSFDPARSYTRVLMQQGRPLTDADWNEQGSLLLEEHRELIRGMIGWHGFFDKPNSEGIEPPTEFAGIWNYYVDGLRCRIDTSKILSVEASQAAAEANEGGEKPADKKQFLLYLEVWERSASVLENPNIVDPAPALRKLDISMRAETRWWIRKKDAPQDGAGGTSDILIDPCKFNTYLDWRPSDCRTIQVKRRAIGGSSSGPCDSLAEQNPCASGELLYRVEIHRRGFAMTLDGSCKGATLSEYATFKWSRANGSVVHAVETPIVGGSQATLHFDRLRASSVERPQLQDRLELFDDSGYPANKSLSLPVVSSVNDDEVVVDGNVVVASAMPSNVICASIVPSNTNYYVREWNHKGVLLLSQSGRTATGDTPPADITAQVSGQRKGKFDESATGQTPPAWSKLSIADDGGALVVRNSDAGQELWLELENGICVRFNSPCYEEGDYWLIRVSSGGTQVIWPNEQPGGEAGNPACMTGAAKATKPSGKDITFETLPRKVPPFGCHHAAPLAVISAEPKSFKAYWRRFSLKYDSKGQKPEATCKVVTIAPEEKNPNEVPGKTESARLPASTEAGIRSSASLLSDAGKVALRRYAGAPREVTRRIPARYLNHNTQSTPLKRWLRTALVSEIHEPTFERFFEKVMRSVSVDEASQALFEADARELYGLATTLHQVVASGGGVRQLVV